MWCPRITHFVRLNPSGKVSRCGHMIDAPEFNTLDEMNNSWWQRNTEHSFINGLFPPECVRCQQVEEKGLDSIRTYSLKLDQQETWKDYLQVGGVLDNVCNAACMTCNPNCSTKIGSLTGRTFPVVNNISGYWALPQDRILHLDINGGEPSYSKNYRRVLEALPPNLKTLRLNTNCNVVLNELTDIANKGIKVTVTVSCDGIGDMHEFMRWPIKWDTFYNNLMTYKSMPVELNLWTTVSILNVDDLPNIQEFAREHEIDHSYAYLKEPAVLDVNNKDRVAVDRYIQEQKQLRGIP